MAKGELWKYVKFMLWALGLKPLVGWYGDEEDSDKNILTATKSMGDSGMPKPTTTPPKSGLLGKLKNQTQEDNRPPGWQTLEELIKKDPMAKTTARSLLNKAVKDGIVEMRKMKSPTKRGFVIRLNYKEKETK